MKKHHHGVAGDDDAFLKPNRLEALQDGVFAIVMTLLVLELKIPEDLHGDGELWAYMRDLWPVFFSYVVTFVNLGVFWVGQHAQYHFIKYSDRAVLWINIAFLLLVSLLPFSTALLGRYGNDQVPCILYGLNVIAIGLASFWHWCYASHHHRLTSHDVSAGLTRGIKRRILVAPCVSVIAILASFLSPMLSLVLYLLLPIYYIWPGRVDQLWMRPAVPHDD
jgi:uncharacterized membrane protein